MMMSVSIPYGSIKRTISAKLGIDPEVSIPYGSIKRVISPYPYHCTSTFQFLMVQLKVIGIVASYKFNMFQFLMVQLKVFTSK